MVSSQSWMVVVLVTISVFSRHSTCTHFNASSPLHYWRDRQVRESVPNSFSDDSSNVALKKSSPSSSSSSSSPFTISPSVSYQFHTNDHEHLDKIVSSHNSNSVRNSFSSGAFAPASSASSGSSSSVRRVGTVSAAAYPQQQQQHAQQVRGDWQERKEQYYHHTEPQAIPERSSFQGKTQTRKTLPSGSSSNIRGKLSSSANPYQSGGNSTEARVASQSSPAKYQSRKDSPSAAVLNGTVTYHSPSTNFQRPLVKQQKPIKSSKRNSTKRKILTSRADTDDADDDEEEDDEEDAQNYDHRYGYLQDDDAGQDDDNTVGGYYSNVAGAGFPALKDFGAGGPVGPGGFTGPGGPDFPGPPLPPTPPIKGTIDYILIPLILIGIAGPIFVVLYVILGGFEYRLAPIARNLKGYTADYQPYIDSLSSSVGRALEKYACYEYASCRVRGAYKKIGFSSATTDSIEEAVNSVTPKEYGTAVSKVFSYLRDPEGMESCEKYQCSDMVQYFL